MDYVLAFFLSLILSCGGAPRNDQSNVSGEITTPSGGPGSPSGVTACSSDNQGNAPFAGGNGQSEYPFVICTVTQFKALADSGCNSSTNTYCDSNFYLGANIDLSGESYEMIGSSTYPFTGEFHGQGYTLSNISINKTGNDVGLFSYIGTDGVVSHLKLTLKNIRSDGHYLGGLAGTNLGTISKVSVRGEKTLGYHISSSNAAPAGLGGLVGHHQGIISLSMADVRITGSDLLGGLVGFSTSIGSISDSYASGVINGNGGGLIGNNAGIITNSYSKTSFYLGTGSGLVKSGSGTVTNSYWDKTSSGVTTSAAGTAHYFYDLTKKTTFDNEDNTNDWDFDSNWSMSDSAEATGLTPELRWENTNAELSFHYLVKTGRKIGYSDQSDFHVWGFCLTQGQAITVTGDATGSTTCNGGQWSLNLDFSSAADGNVTISAISGGTTLSRTFTKAATTCSTRSGYNNAAQEQDADSRFIICTNAQWNDISRAITNTDIPIIDGGIRLYDNIDFEGGAPTPFEMDGFNGAAVTEKIDGNGFRLENFSATASPVSSAIIGVSSTDLLVIRDLGIEDSRVISGGNIVGGFIATTDADIYSVYFQGVVEAKSYTGGITGKLTFTADQNGTKSEGYLENSFFLGSVHGTSNVGGLSGILEGGADAAVDTFASMARVFMRGAVFGTSFVGGISGSASGAVTASYVHANVFSTGNYSGGVFGHLFNSSYDDGGGSYGPIEAKILDSHVTGRVHGASYVGGVAGKSATEHGSSNLYADVFVFGTSLVGGIAGWATENVYYEGTTPTTYFASNPISKAYSVGDIIAVTSTAGGIIGSGSAAISASYSSSNIYSANNVGGIAGQATEFNNEEDSGGNPSGADIQTAFTSSTSFIGAIELTSAGTAGPIIGLDSTANLPFS